MYLNNLLATVCVIHHNSLKFTLLLAMFLLGACDDSSAGHLKSLKTGEIIIPSEGGKLKTYIALSAEEQMKGLSGIQPQDFNDNEAMLFTAKRDKLRQFWMPNTHFDLDIFFLSEDLYVLEVHRALNHFKDDGPDHKVPRSKMVVCRHVLEIKASSPLAKKIYPGMQLKWKGSSSLSKIISDTHT